jgi:hypothetical protein
MGPTTLNVAEKLLLATDQDCCDLTIHIIYYITSWKPRFAAA